MYLNVTGELKFGDFVKRWLFIFVMIFFSLFVTDLMAGFVDYPTVYVVDQDYRPVSGVEVTVTYQKNWQGDYVTSFPVLTNSQGKVELRVSVPVAEEYDFDTSYTVAISHMGYTDSKKLTYNPNADHGQTYFNIPLHQFRAYLTDTENKPVNASVTIMGQIEQTDKGFAWFHLPPGEFLMNVTYDSANHIYNVTMGEDDYNDVFILNEYYPTIEFVSDNGDHLNGTLSACGKEYDINSPEQVRMSCSPAQVAVAEVGENRLTQNVDFSQDFVMFIFDFTLPTVNEVVFSSDNSKWVVTVDAEDPGIYSSGLKDEIPMSYSILNPGATTPIKRQTGLSYDNNLGKYIGTFEPEQKDTRIDATISISDNSGNIERFSTVFIVGKDILDVIPVNDTNNTNGDGNNGNGSGNNGIGFDWILLIIIAVIIVIVLLGAYFYLQSSKEEYVE